MVIRRLIGCGALAATLFFCICDVGAQSTAPDELPDAYPRAGATQILDNSVATVWDVTWEPGKATELHRHRLDFVALDLYDAAFRSIAPSGEARTIEVKAGDINYIGKGLTHIEEPADDGRRRRAVIVTLKDRPMSSIVPVETGSSPFSDVGSRLVVDNDRVRVWEHIWGPEKSPGTYSYRTDTIIVFIEGGTLTSVNFEGGKELMKVRPGEVIYRAPRTMIREFASEGRIRAMVVEIK